MRAFRQNTNCVVVHSAESKGRGRGDDGRRRERRACGQDGRHRDRNGNYGHRCNQGSVRHGPDGRQLRLHRQRGRRRPRHLQQHPAVRPLSFACNTSEIALVLFAALIGWPFPLLPIQLLWINLVTDGLPALALAMEKPESDVMSRRPRSPNESFFTRQRGSQILIHGLIDGDRETSEASPTPM